MSLPEELVEREIAAEQRFVDRVYVQLEKSAPGRPGAGPRGPRPRPARPRGRPGRARRHGLPGRQADRPARRRARGPGVRPARPAPDARPCAALHRPDRAARRQPRLAADRLAGARRPPCSTRPPPPTPHDVVRRRVLRCAGPHGASASRTSCSTPTAETDLPIVGEGALMAQLSRARDRSMHSIVATIQAEQDQAIRAPGKGVVSITGGPGTGKTVVALHRAAYLLYTDRRRYEGGGVLDRRPLRGLHALHRAGAALPGRDRGRAAVAGRGRRRRPRHPARRAGGRRREGLGADGRADAAYGPPAGARLAHASSGSSGATT